MTADWHYFDPTPPLQGGRYDCAEVLKADRWAWASEVTSKRAGFFYDGIDFWRRLRSGQRQVVSQLDAPGSGWWHKPACNCPLCDGRVADSAAPQCAAERS